MIGLELKNLSQFLAKTFDLELLKIMGQDCVMNKYQQPWVHL